MSLECKGGVTGKESNPKSSGKNLELLEIRGDLFSGGTSAPSVFRGV